MRRGLSSVAAAPVRSLKFLARLASRATNPITYHRAQLRWKFRHAGLRSHRCALPNGQLHVWMGGNTGGRALVLLQGFGGNAKYQWHPQVGSFSKSHRVIVPDLLFFGESTSSRPERSIDFQAETIIQLMDAQGIDQFDLLGLSYGGMVAYRLAAQYPHRVRRLVMTSSPGANIERADYDSLLRRFRIDHINELLIPETSIGVRQLIGIAYHRPPRVPGFVLSEIFDYLYTNQVQQKRELMEDLVDMLNDDARHQARPPQQTLVVWGEHDHVFPVELGRRLVRRLGAQARFCVVPKTAHAPNQENPREFNALVLGFFAAPNSPL